MATFAKLDENNIVTQIVKVGNDVPTSDGPLGDNDMHVDGETYCTNLFGGTWKQCSATNAFRKQNAGIGQTYDSVKDKFIKPQPYPSWSLDSNDDWQPPVARPAESTLILEENVSILRFANWNEAEYRWESQDVLADPMVDYHWNTDTNSWVAS
tara:strand:+ start:6300 stop:6761 length:462 start_codon:yes stop_codon:yes gene_type:complete